MSKTGPKDDNEKVLKFYETVFDFLPEHVKCKTCGKTNKFIKGKTKTSNLVRHIRSSKHAAVYKQYEQFCKCKFIFKYSLLKLYFSCFINRCLNF